MTSPFILFLDFDGVLHPDPPTNEAPLFCRAFLLKEWLEAHPHVDVVISSTWRLKRSLPELQALFPKWGDRIIGVTTEIPQESYLRQYECESWMRDNADPWIPWLALDDRSWNFQPFEKRLVLTDRKIGLTETDLVRLTKAMGT